MDSCFHAFYNDFETFLATAFTNWPKKKLIDVFKSPTAKQQVSLCGIPERVSEICI